MRYPLRLTAALAALTLLVAGCADTATTAPDQAGRPSFASGGGSGAIWTTKATCGTPDQDVNHFNAGDAVYINGENFDLGLTYDWSITGNPGGASTDPNTVVAGGTLSINGSGGVTVNWTTGTAYAGTVTGAGGAFCFQAYLVQSDDGGEYQVKVGSKGDNYRVRGDIDLAVSKTALTKMKRTWTWDLDKSADQTALTLSTGQTFNVNYALKASYTSAESEWTVYGVITILNDGTGKKATTVSQVVDTLQIGGSTYVGTVTGCYTAANLSGTALTFPYPLATDASIYCGYTYTFASDPGDGIGQNVASSEASVVIHGGGPPTTEPLYFSSDPVDFTFNEASTTPAPPAVTEIDKCISVTDAFNGGAAETKVTSFCASGLSSGGYVSLGAGSSYSRTIGPYATCGNYRVDNLATLTTNTTATQDTDGWTVAVTVPCGSGCTLTQGYWKTHSDKGPAPYDETWALLPGGLGANTVFFLSGQTWYQVFWTAPAGNAYYNLAHQYMAARLNLLNGADGSVVASALASATTLFNTYTPAQIAALKGSSALRAQFISLAGTLGSFNEGLIGPGHCSE